MAEAVPGRAKSEENLSEGQSFAHGLHAFSCSHGALKGWQPNSQDLSLVFRTQSEMPDRCGGVIGPRSIWVPASRKLAMVSRVQAWGGQEVAKQRLADARQASFLHL